MCFRKGHSTFDNIANLHNIVTNNMDSGRIVVVVYLDFMKAFDKRWTDGIIRKLMKFGIKGNILSWLKEYLSNRNFRVDINGNLSESFTTDNGVPQGGCLGLCYLI